MSYVIMSNNEYFIGFHVMAGDRYPSFNRSSEKAKKWKRANNARNMCHELNTTYNYWTDGFARVGEIDDTTEPETTENKEERDYIVQTKQTLCLYSIISAKSADEARKKMRIAIKKGITGYESATDSHIQVSGNAKISFVQVVPEDNDKEVEE